MKTITTQDENFWISCEESKPELLRWCRVKRNDEWVTTGRRNQNGRWSLKITDGLNLGNAEPTHWFYVVRCFVK